MNLEKKQQLSGIREELEQIVRAVHELGVKESDLAHRLDPIEKAAIEIGDHRTSGVIREAYISLIDAGRLFTQIHLDLNVPPTVFQPPEEQEEAA